MQSGQYVSEIRLCRPHASGPNGRKQIIRTVRGKGHSHGTEEGRISFAYVPSIQKKEFKFSDWHLGNSGLGRWNAHMPSLSISLKEPWRGPKGHQNQSFRM